MGYIINDTVIDQIHENADLIDIISKYVSLKRTGSNYVGLCPFHNEKTPSFTVSQAKQLFHCFGCNEGGDIITFIMKMENLSFIEAAKYLADYLNINVETKENEIYNKVKKEKELVYKINREAAKYYYMNLRNTNSGLKYLKNRNIDPKTMNSFGLGYASDKWNNIYNYLKGKGYSEEDIEKAGLISKRRDNKGYYDKFRNRIIFPIIDLRKRVIGFGGRILDDKMPKYLNSPDTVVFEKGNNLYGLNLINKFSDKKKIILVEGYMDVISLFNYGIKYSVASLGTAFTPKQARLLKRYGKQIYMCYDSDNAGINATTKSINILKKEGVDPKVIILPKGYDPDDFIKENGLNEFLDLQEKALSYIEYYIFIYKKKYDLSDSEGKIKFIKEISKILKEMQSSVEIEVYIDKISKETSISKEAIKREVFNKNYSFNSSIAKDKYINGKNRNNKNSISPVRTVLESAHLTAEKTLIRLMLKNRDYFNLISRNLTNEDFYKYEYRLLVEIIFTEYEDNLQLMELDIEDMMIRLKDKRNVDFTVLEELNNLDIDDEYVDINKLIGDLINTVKYYKLTIKRKEIVERINEFERKEKVDKEDVEEFKKLCLKLTELDKELKPHT